jgi:hypothetical protein
MQHVSSCWRRAQPGRGPRFWTQDDSCLVLSEAEMLPLVGCLDRTGRPLNRPWTLALSRDRPRLGSKPPPNRLPPSSRRAPHDASTPRAILLLSYRPFLSFFFFAAKRFHGPVSRGPPFVAPTRRSAPFGCPPSAFTVSPRCGDAPPRMQASLWQELRAARIGRTETEKSAQPQRTESNDERQENDADRRRRRANRR